MRKIKLFDSFDLFAKAEERAFESESAPEKENVFTITKAPDALPNDGRPSVFLAGSIEMGKAEDWQTKVQDIMKGENVAIYNPRRDDWDSSWKQEMENPKFREQVEWELNALDRSSVIIMYFDPATKSPITLLELGIHAQSGKLLVCCPDGFWRKGNVDIVCAKYNVPTFTTIEELTAAAMTKLKSMYA